MLSNMQKLDPNDPRPDFQQVRGIIRTAILTGEYEPTAQLPSIPDLSRHFGLARATVQKAVDLLKAEGLVVGRQGKGLFVRQRTERPVGLRPHVEQLFTSPEVRIDFAGFSGETLHGVIQEPLDKIRAGQLDAKNVTIRVLVPDMSRPIGLPSLVPNGEDSVDVRERMGRIVQRSAQVIVDSVCELAALGLLDSGVAEVRTAHIAPLFKLFILNGVETFFGFYPVVKHTVAVKGKPTDIFDPMGKDATLFHFAATDDPDSVDSRYVEQAQTWFDTVWNSVARDYDPT
jgi:DNA-binding transcriptional regulator YhcF (GntR family)